MADDLFEREWDSADSNLYQDGYGQAEADIRDGRPCDDRAGAVPSAWTEGYRDCVEEGNGDG